MKFEIETSKLNNILSRVSKGLGKSKVFPVTEYLKIVLQEGALEITATDTVNFIHYNQPGISGEEGQVIVQADPLIKLVTKTTKDKMKFEFDGASLVAHGNGKYKLPVFESEEFPGYEFNFEAEAIEVSTIILKDVFNTNEAAIAKDMTMPVLTGYNIGERVVTTDGIKMCINNTTLFDTPMLITQELADLLHTLNSDKVKIQKEGNKILFTTDNIVIFGTELDGVEEYPDITALAELEYGNQVKISKSALLNIIDRLSIFVDKNDNNGVRLMFEQDRLTVEDIKKNSKEEIGYIESVIEEPSVLCVNIDFLKDLLSVLSEADVVVKYSEGLPVTITEKNVTLILSTMEDVEVK